ncbi:hydantoinase/oxoprolinase family protein [Gottfriedia sp. NPDC056225]|uniref:hydantoinase/oxoprolinase family protein n=1 Tax=Gottfriedia sp. NPDC056225 TaxID=3345751 RepID=UPI0035DEB9AA
MRVATDIGGTFTDLVFLDENGRIGVAKSDTTPPNFEQGVIDVMTKSGIQGDAIQAFIHGTTVIINALTERKGVKTGLITTKGFRDVIEIARGNRPDLFNVRYQKPTPFVPRHLRIEVSERLNYKGDILQGINLDEVKVAVEQLKKEGVDAIAVSFLHAYANPIHEKAVIEMIQQLWPEVYVTASSDITKEWREYERTNTAVLNSYIKPIAVSYIDRLEKKLQDIGVSGNKYIMQSNSGTTTFNQSKESPINMVESGPVAGIFGAAILGKLLGEENIIAFDIGGTTAKCSLINKGEVKVTTDYRIERDERNAGYPIKVPVVDIVEIGNGGGSIAWIDGAGSLKVGPQSAGALPGPVAYGQGGEDPTTTDANLVTGRLSPKNFKKPVDLESVRVAIQNKISEHFEISIEDAALGIIRIANSNMLNALKLISVRKGYDPREFSLVAFGGGGPMHAMSLAKELGVRKVIIPIASSVFSAWGMLMTDLRQDYIQTYIRRVNTIDFNEINSEWAKIEENAIEQYKVQDISEKDVVFIRYADMRYLGQEHTVKVPIPNGLLNSETMKVIVERFHQIHEQQFTFKLEGAPTEIVNLHLTALGTVQKPKIAKLKNIGDNADSTIKEVRNVLFEDYGWIKTNIYERDLLNAGSKIDGPAIVEEQSSSTVLYPNQSLTVDPYGNLIIETGV